MNNKQRYYGNVKNRSNTQKDETLVNLYRESEANDDVTDFLDNNADVNEEQVTEKRSAKQKREKAAKKAEKSKKTKKRAKRIIIVILLLAAIGGGAWFILQPGRSQNDQGELAGNQATPDEIYYSRLSGVEASKDAVNRPATCVMIENSPAARPQSGINEAGIVYEAIAEGGITRFMAIFQDTAPNYIGPVRSVRMTYAELAKPYHCSIAHVGGSDNALRLIRNNSEFRDIDQFYNDKAYWRIRTRQSPHNVYTRFSMLDELNFNKGYRSSDFKGLARVKPDTTPEKPTTAANKITIPMSAPLYNPVYTYDANTNKYLRSYVQGGAHYAADESGNKTQIAPDVVVAMSVNSVARKGEEQYADYTTTGKGDAHIFQNGGVISAQWERTDANAELKFIDTSGSEIQLNRGQTWITLYPSNNKVTWE